MADKEIKIKLSIDGKEVTASITNADELLKKLKTTATDTRKTFAEWGSIITGINQGIQLVSQTFSALGASMKMGAEIEVLRANFKGTAEDIELFRKATAGTVKEGTLIQLSNQATRLKLSMQDQALLFNVAEDSVDSLGGTVDENFRSMVFSTEGLTKALKSMGYQKEVYEEILNRLALAEGDEIDKLDAETQKRVRINTILEVTGVTMADVTGKTKDTADKLESLGVKAEEAKEKFGMLLNDALIPVYDKLEDAGIIGDAAITTFGGLGEAATIAAPMLTPLVLVFQNLSIAVRSAWLSTLGWVGVAIAAGVVAKEVFDWANKPYGPGGLGASDAYNKKLSEGSEADFPDQVVIGKKKGKVTIPKAGKKLTPAERLRLEIDIARENLEWALAQSRANKETFDDILKNAPPKYTGTLGGVEVPDKPGEVGMDSSNKTFTDMTGQTRALSLGAYSANMAFQTLGRTISQALGNAVRIFKQANSVLQNFINSLAEAASQLLIMQTIKGLFNLATGGVGGFMGGFTMLAEGGVATRPTFAMIGEAGPEAVIPLRNLPSFAPQTINVQFAPVEMKQRGMDMRGSINATERYLTRNR